MTYEDELDRMRSRKRQQHGKKKRNITKQPTQRLMREDRIYYNMGNGRNPRVKYNNHQRSQKGVPKHKKKHKHKLGFFKFIGLVFILLAGAFFLKQHNHEKGYWTIAVFGVDSREGSLGKGTLSDVIMLCNINKDSGEIKLVSVYRDTYLKINSKGTYHKINEAYFKGGHQQALEAINENLDLQVDDYATFNWSAVASAINILGGIDLEISDSEFAYINSFITETVQSTEIGSYQLKKPGMNHLDGVQAVAYARLRLMDTDFNRTERQRKVVNLVMEKVKKANFSTLRKLVSSVYPQISTSIGMDDTLTIAKGVRKYHIGETTGFPFSHASKKIGKRDCVIPATLESNVRKLHEFLYDQVDYTSTESVKKISAKIAQKSGITKPAKNTLSG